MEKEGVQKLRKMVSATTIASILIISISMIATVPAFAKPSSKNLEGTIKNAFTKYLKQRGLGDIESASEQQASELFSAFLNDNPSYADLLNAYYEASGQYTSLKEDIDITYEQLQEGKVLEVVNTYTKVVGDVEYTVEITKVEVERTTIYKANYKSADGSIIEDPYIYVKHAYLYFWWWRTGEFVELHYKFMKNAGGINEASRFRYTLDTYLHLASVPIGIVCSLLAPYTFGLTVIPGAIWIWMVLDIKTELNYAYQNTANYLRILHRVSHNYAGIGSWYDLHTIWGDGSWHMIGIPMIDIGFTTNILLNAYKGLGNSYGYNQWAWVGTYYG